MKRKAAATASEASTPRKTRRVSTRTKQVDDEDELDSGRASPLDSTPTQTSLKRKQPLAPFDQYKHIPTTPSKSLVNRIDATPQKAHDFEDENGIPLVRNANQSARRKSARQLLQRNVVADESDEEGLDEEVELAHEILEDDEGAQISDEEEEQEVAEENEEENQEAPLEPETPSKRGRGRPKGRKKQRTPTPPPDLPPYEKYFFDNRPGGGKVSKNAFTASLLSHEDYFETMHAFKDPHEKEISFLHTLHSRSFGNWAFELEQGFNLCLYGLGSKRLLMLDFAAHLMDMAPKSKVVVVNGYNASTNIRTILTTLASVIPSLSASNQKLGAQPADMLSTIISALTAHPPALPHTIILHSIDSATLRRLATQSLLARLASSPHIRLVASADTPNFPLLWDAALCAQFRWLYHDCTTFRPLHVEIAAGGAGGGVVDEINALLGRSGRKMQGREGVMYVLRSLTESARSLYALLIAEILSMDDIEGDMPEADPFGENGDEDNDYDVFATPRKGGNSARSGISGMTRPAGIDFRTLYQKATTQFIATNETTFRGLLREFYDHEMVVSRKDGMGGEVFGVPFRKEEMGSILGELVA